MFLNAFSRLGTVYFLQKELHMNFHERRIKALQNLEDYWEQSIGMLQAVDYVATDRIFADTVRWRNAIRHERQRVEEYYRIWKLDRKINGKPPWAE